ncbi:MAG: hypothetical protein AABZ06_03970 [Bdellovibrionota bacterium]
MVQTGELNRYAVLIIRTMKFVAPLILLLAITSCTNGNSSDDERSALISRILPQWKTAWNNKDSVSLLSLYHPNSESYEKAKGKLNDYKESSIEIFDHCGIIIKYEVRKYIEDKKRYVVRIEYTKIGIVPATFELVKDAAGAWKIKDFNIDGQGESELKE